MLPRSISTELTYFSGSGHRGAAVGGVRFVGEGSRRRHGAACVRSPPSRETDDLRRRPLRPASSPLPRCPTGLPRSRSAAPRVRWALGPWAPAEQGRGWGSAAAAGAKRCFGRRLGTRCRGRALGRRGVPSALQRGNGRKRRTTGRESWHTLRPEDGSVVSLRVVERTSLAALPRLAPRSPAPVARMRTRLAHGPAPYRSRAVTSPAPSRWSAAPSQSNDPSTRLGPPVARSGR